MLPENVVSALKASCASHTPSGQHDPNGPAADKGIREGDIIKMVGNTKVSEPAEVVAEVKKAADKERKSVLLLLERNGSDRFVAVGIV